MSDHSQDKNDENKEEDLGNDNVAYDDERKSDTLLFPIKIICHHFSLRYLNICLLQ